MAIHSVTCKQAIPAFTPQLQSITTLGWYSFYRPMEGRRLRWPERWKLLKQNFENFNVRGRLKNAKIAQNFQVLRLQAIITLHWLLIAGNSLPIWPSMGRWVSIFTIRITSKSFPWTVHSTQERYIQIFGNLWCPILGIKTNSTPQFWCALATDIWKSSRLNWKLKISNAADNADITQLQARDTRHRRMQEVNSLCTYSRPLHVNTVLCHSTQYSLLVNYFVAFISFMFVLN